MAKKRARTAKKRAAAKRRPAKRAVLAKVRNAKARSSSSAAKVAERERPGWTAVAKQQIVADTPAESVGADASVPELGQLKQRYFGVGGYANGASAPTADAEIVTMEPKVSGADLRAGRKASVVQKNRVIGSQG
jgi:hypothetical protein